MSYYKYNHKTVKAWRRVFFFLFEASIVNSLVIFQAKNSLKIEGKTFRLNLAKRILNNDKSLPSEKSHDFSFSLFDYKRLNERHFIIKNDKYKLQDCYVCSSRKKDRNRTSFICEQFSNPMCLDCFKVYHTQKNY